MENIHYADDRYSAFLERKVKGLKAEKNQGFLANIFRALTGSRHRTSHRQVTGIPPMPITSGSTATTDPEVITAAMPPVSCKEQIKPAQEQLVPVPFMEPHMQPSVDNKLGGSYIMEAQVT